MRICFACILLFLTTIAAHAKNLPPYFSKFPMSQVSYRLSVEKWASTDTAKVTLNVDAALDKIGLAHANSHVMANLNKIVPHAGWHITRLERKQDKSGLEMLHAEAQAQVPQVALSHLYKNAKSVSLPGETYRVSDIDFTPPLRALEKTRLQARAEIYAQVSQEIAKLNKMYPKRHYFLYQITIRSNNAPRPAPAFYRKAHMMVASAAVAPDITMPVQSKLLETADVVIAALLPGVKSGSELFS